MSTDMLDEAPLVVLGVVPVLLALLAIRKSASTFEMYRTLSTANEDTARGVLDGSDDAVITGTLRVREPVELPVANTASQPVGLYKWRFQEKRTRSRSQRKRRSRPGKRSKTTWSSNGWGIEYGSIAVDDGTGELAIDLTELNQRHDQTDSERRYKKGPFGRTAISFDSQTIKQKFEDSTAVPQRLSNFLQENDAVGDESREKKLQLHYLTDGDSVMVRGAVDVVRGTPTIGGGEATSMMLSDRDPDELASELFQKTVIFGGLALFLFAFGGYFLYGVLLV